MKLLIRGGHLIDPSNNIDGTCDILLKDRKVARVDKKITAENAKIVDAKGKLIIPGLIDMHAHLRQPGREDEETLASGSRAAAKGGFTTICAMPNTEPCCDNRGAVEYIISEARNSAIINILPIGAMTAGRKGEEIAEIADMKQAGIVGVSDDGTSIRDSQLMRKVLEYSSMFDLIAISHCEDPDLAAGGVMNEGFNSTLLGMRGIPNISEAVIVARDIMLAELTSARLHIAHVSTEESTRAIREAKKRGVRVTCETAPHYFTLSDDELRRFDTNLKVNPPLRSKKDVNAVKEGLKDGTIDVIATDHAPHTEAEKDVEFDFAPCGMIGLESAFSVAAEELVDKNIISLKELVEKFTNKPAQILNARGKGSLSAGSDADLVIIEPDAEWALGKDAILSKSKNSPFIGRKFRYSILHTVCGGKIVYSSK